MPNKIEKNPDGNFHIELETGEIFDGDPLTVTTKLAEAQVNTKRWGQGFKQQAETLQQQAQQLNQQPVQPTAPTFTPEEQQIQNYLLDNTAKALGYSSGAEMRQDLGRMKTVSDETQNQLVAGAFLAQCQDFPNTPESIDVLGKKIEEMGWDFSPQSMIAAHALCLREHAADANKGYAGLTQDQIQQSIVAESRARETRNAPPMISSRAPDSSQQGGNDPWAMKMEDLRAAAIRQQLEGK